MPSQAAKSVYGSLCLALGLLASSSAIAPVRAEPGDALVQEARDVLRKRDKTRLAQLRAATLAQQHPLAQWVDYWELNNRLSDASVDEVEAFYARWPASYVEDRLRNDFLLELGRRRDWAAFARDFPRFRMNDDREVSCYALLTDHLAGKGVTPEAARGAWLAQRDADNGCNLMAKTLMDDRVLTPADAWQKARWALDANRPRAAQLAVVLAAPSSSAAINELNDGPARYLRRASAADRTGAELATLALIRLAGTDAADAAAQLTERWERALPADLAGTAWAAVAKQTALKLLPEASDQYQRATLAGKGQVAEASWPADTLGWKVRAALRANQGAGRWQQVMQAIDAMPAAEQRDPTWLYWKARALQTLARDSQDGAALRQQAQALLSTLAGQYHFYGQLATEELGQPLPLPPAPRPLSRAERDAAAKLPGFQRALQLIALGLRNEGVREWNFSLRDLSTDRELLAAAQLACDREVWDRCINTSDRTRTEIDMNQRFPLPFRNAVVAQARNIGLDPAYVYGLIRQESRFVTDARSGVGASGLMQVMPATARWTAKRAGLNVSPDDLHDRDTNILIGTHYLKYVLDDFGGSQAMAAAAYNAGPGRPRRWREGATLDTAAWAENVPFAETRDYVKKVLSNATFYAGLLGNGQPASLKTRLGQGIGPRDPAAATPNKDLP
ncbi:MAG: hypothetical protein RJA98_3197 [Pseudomonadota bacterium]